MPRPPRIYRSIAELAETERRKLEALHRPVELIAPELHRRWLAESVKQALAPGGADGEPHDDPADGDGDGTR